MSWLLTEASDFEPDSPRQRRQSHSGTPSRPLLHGSPRSKGSDGALLRGDHSCTVDAILLTPASASQRWVVLDEGRIDRPRGGTLP
jgi:hypothetical protein